MFYIKTQNPIINNEYEILNLLGAGSTARVYLCRSVGEPEKKVALKLVTNDFIKKHGKLIETEIRIHQTLQHPNIVPIHEVGEHQGRPYFTMELIEGRTLSDLARSKELTQASFASLNGLFKPSSPGPAGV